MHCLTKNGNRVELIGSGDMLVIGVFHGDEPQGKFLIEHSTFYTLHSKFSFIPCLNPDGLAAGTRGNANGVDLNRNFPTVNWEPGAGGEAAASEIETRFLIDVIEKHKPRLILTLHAPFKVVNYDGPAQGAALKAAKIFNYPVQEDIGYPTPGSFGTWAGVERGIPVITLELDETCPVSELLAPFDELLSEV